MKIGLQTWGSEGDVRPFLALASGLASRGHEVMLAITSPSGRDYSSYVSVSNFKILHASDTYREWNQERISLITYQKLIQEKNPLKVMESMSAEFFEPAVDEMYELSKTLCEENDIVIGHFLVHTLQVAAMKVSCKYAMLNLCPSLYPSRYIPPPAAISLGNWMNPWLWRVTKKVLNKTALKYPNEFRRKQGVSEARDAIKELWQSDELTLISTSASLFERPADWSSNLKLCGFLGLDKPAEGWLMPDALADFINDGEAPVYFTFGVASSVTLNESLDIFVDSIKRSKCRAIIQAPWSSIRDKLEHPDIFFIEHAPHENIFPYCSLVVHHGGAGTTHSATRCACPSIVVEHFQDQYFWGTLLKKKGLTTKVLHRSSLNAKALAAEIQKILGSPLIKENALKLSEAMKLEEDGVQQAVNFIEAHFFGC